METSETTRPEEDWLVTERVKGETHEACLLSMSTSVQIGRYCCRPCLTLEEAKELLENVWYEMADED